jgi:hypothetical protein
MPQIYRYLKLVFYFVARGEHLPPHVHVVDENNNQSVFDLVIKDGLLSEIRIRRKKGFLPISEKNQTIVKNFIHIYYADIVTKWVEFFILGKEVKSVTIKKIENLSVDTQKLAEHIKDLNKHFYPGEKKKPNQISTSKNKKK